MFRHNLLITYRNFLRYKSSFFINLVGLSTGLASALLIYLWVNDELSIDKFHEKDKRLYQVMERWETGDGIKIDAGTRGGIVAEVLAEEMPEVEYAAAVAPPTWRGFDGFVLSAGERDIRARGQYVGEDYFNIFSYGLISGDPDHVLKDKNSIVITESLAMKLFDTIEGLVGKAIEFQHEREFLISGILEDLPASSSVKFDFALSFETYLDIAPWYRNWGSIGPHAYVILKEGTDINQFNEKIADLIQNKTNGDIKFQKLFLASYSDDYLYGNYVNGVQSGGRIEYVKLFSVVAVFILIIACINFMNLSTAKAASRTKEVGVKKSLGAKRKHLAVQYISESILMTSLSLGIALILVAVALPQFNLITGKQLTLTLDLRFMLSTISGVLVTGLIAGSYPALYLSGFNPVAVLKGKLKTSIGELWVRKGLVAFQFTLSIILVVLVLVVYKQIEFVQSQHLGYDKDNVIYFDVEGRVKGNTETFLSEIKKIPGILSAAGTTHNMIGRNWATGMYWEGKDPDKHRDVLFQIMAVSHDFLETVGLEMKEGRFFSRDFGADTTRIIFNEAAIEIMGYENPIGRRVEGAYDNYEIIGVVKDFHFESFHNEVQPQYFILHRKRFAAPKLIMARIEAGKEAETLGRLSKFYQTYNPGFPLNYTFLDDDYQAQYTAELRVSALSRYFTGLAIIISCLGLIALAAFTAQKRLKEIGIRKILGSSDFGIVRLLSSDFTKTVLVAIVIAQPVSYFLAQKWLDGFAYRIELEWWFFVGSSLLALLIAWLTIGAQTIKAAHINPSQCLRSE